MLLRASLPLERCRNLERVARLEERVAQEPVQARPPARTQSWFGRLDVVLRAPQLDVRTNQCPVGAAASLIRHTHAAGVYDSPGVERTVELRMGVPAHHDAL